MLGLGSLAHLEFELFSCIFVVHHDKPMKELVIPVQRECFLCCSMG